MKAVVRRTIVSVLDDDAIAKLNEKNVGQEAIDSFAEVIDQCEFARYAPSGGSEARVEIYKKAERTISLFEKQIKR